MIAPSHAPQHALPAMVPDHPLVVVDLDGQVQSWSAGAERVCGYEAGQIVGRGFTTCYAPGEPRGRLRDEIAEALRAGYAEGEGWMLRPDGGRAWVRRTLAPLRDLRHQVHGIAVILCDLTTRRRAELELREREERFREMVEGTAGGFFYSMDDQGRFRYLSPSVRDVLGYSADELVGRPLDLAARSEEREPSAAADRPRAGRALRVLRKDGEIVHLEVVENAPPATPQTGSVGFARDVSRQKEREDQLTHTALHDPLTGLPNRALFWDRLRQATHRAERAPERLFAVLMLDLDRFKAVNDTLGHLAGDQLLLGVARRLERCVRPGDTVSRFGGDEFAILLDGIRDADGATRVARRITRALGEPFRLGGDYAFGLGSIGIAVSGTEHQPPEALVHCADLAMYRAKALGVRHEVFDPGARCPVSSAEE